MAAAAAGAQDTKTSSGQRTIATRTVAGVRKWSRLVTKAVLRPLAVTCFVVVGGGLFAVVVLLLLLIFVCVVVVCLLLLFCCCCLFIFC